MPESTFLRVLVCPNAFKNSLTAVQAAAAISAGMCAGEHGTRVRCHQVPLADGGDGTLETLVAATGGEIICETVTDPIGRPVRARWGRLGGARRSTAVIEMAEASGLRLLKSDERDVLHASTFGTGELIRAAMSAGCDTLLIGIGGSATNDGGAGVAQALGIRMLDATGRDIDRGGGALGTLASIDLSRSLLRPGIRVQVACDVDNPLFGPEGASAVYGPQKGASVEDVHILDAALRHLDVVWKRDIGKDVAGVPGAGAAGGLGAGLMAFCGADLVSGIDLAMDAVGFDEALARCDVVVTGEGSLDSQTARGKAVSGICARARRRGVPVVALAGSAEPGVELAIDGLTAALSIVPGPMELTEAMQDAPALLHTAASRLSRLLLIRP